MPENNITTKINSKNYDILKCAGIYRIVVNRPGKSKKFYIGQSSLLRKRRNVHFNHLRKGVHKNQLLQRAFAKYGEAAFSFEILVICEKKKDILDFYEQSILDSYSDDDIYNLCRECVGSKLGTKLTEDHIIKFGRANRGKVRSQEHRDAVSRSNKGRIVSEETKARMSAAHMGNKYNLGKKLSQEQKAKISAFFTGRKKSPEEIARRQATRAANAAIRGTW